MRQDYRWVRNVSLASSIGLVLVISIVIGWGLGSWLDTRFGTSPWLMLVGTMLGIAAGFIEMVNIARQLFRDE